ncbi:hypothetical protein JCM10213v2_002484 [Rhodosporidiobolus nylandii]
MPASPSASAQRPSSPSSSPQEDPLTDAVPPPSAFSRFRRRLAYLLDRPATHWTIVLLSLLDFLFTLSELVYVFLKDTMCECDNSCPEEPALLEVFDVLSLLITGTFCLEIPLDLLAFGPAHDLSVRHHWLHCFDALVVIVAFVLEIVLKGAEKDVASLVIILRLWRLVKLLSTLEVGRSEYEEQTEVSRERQQWEAEREKLSGEIWRLRRRLWRYEGRENSGDDEDAS